MLLQYRIFQCTILSRTVVPVTTERGFTMKTLADYTKQAIIETIADITSEHTLEYIYSMIMAALVAETHQEGC